MASLQNLYNHVKSLIQQFTYLKNEIDTTFANKSELANIEYITGTHGTTATSTWTGTSTKISSLQKGQVIYFKMTSAGTGAGNTLNLTLKDGTTKTGAKNIYYNASERLTTQFPVNTVLCLVYDGTNWICTAIRNTNFFERIYSNAQVYAGEKLRKNGIIVGQKNYKYYNLKANLTFNIRYPILWTGAEIAINGNSNNVYLVYLEVDLRTTVSGKTVTNQRQVYIEGTNYENGDFTTSTNVFVSDGNLTNGRYYIPIGMSYSTTNIRFDATEKKVYYYNGTNLVPVEDVKYAKKSEVGGLNITTINPHDFEIWMQNNIDSHYNITTILNQDYAEAHGYNNPQEIMQQFVDEIYYGRDFDGSANVGDMFSLPTYYSVDLYKGNYCNLYMVLEDTHFYTSKFLEQIVKSTEE